jgi:phosphohistidine phosphatase
MIFRIVSWGGDTDAMPSTSRLHLLRHAKSDWNDPTLPDHERPLNARGRREAEQLRRHVETTGLRLDLVLCSSALRTRETWAAVQPGLAIQPKVRIVSEIYDATARELLDVIHTVDPEVASVLVVGHNPGTADLIHGLVGSGNPEALDRLRDGVPPACFVTLTTTAAWADLAAGGGQLDEVVRPRDLEHR